MKSTQATIATLFEHNAGSGDGAFGGYINDVVSNRVELYQRGTGGATYVDDAVCPLDGNWHHFATTIDSTLVGTNRIKLYIDGIEAGGDNPSYPGAGDPSLLNAGWAFGQRSGTDYRFNGLLDEVRISSGLLDPSQFLNVPPTPAPEPTTATLLGLGLIGLATRRRRRLNATSC